MSDNRKFVAMLISQDDIDFEEEFRALPEKDQHEFIDFFIAFSVHVMKELHTLPLDLQILALANGFGALTSENAAILSQMLGEDDPFDI